MAEELAIVGSAEQASAMLDAVRLRLLGELADPGSASGLARRLGLPRQRVNYHLRELERVGLVEFVEERRKGNCTERIVRATARSYLIDPAVLGPLGADSSGVEGRAGFAHLMAVAARTIREAAAGLVRAGGAGSAMAATSVEAEVRLATDGDRAAFAEDVANAVAQVVREYQDAGGGRYRVVVGGYAV